MPSFIIEKSDIKIMVNYGHLVYGKFVPSHQLDFRGFLLCFLLLILNCLVLYVWSFSEF